MLKLLIFKVMRNGGNVRGSYRDRIVSGMEKLQMGMYHTALTASCELPIHSLTFFFLHLNLKISSGLEGEKVH